VPLRTSPHWLGRGVEMMRGHHFHTRINVFDGVLNGDKDRADAQARRGLSLRNLTLAQKRENLVYIFVALPLGYFLIVNLSAMGASFLFSFQNYSRSARANLGGLDNYAKVFADPEFVQALRTPLSSPSRACRSCWRFRSVSR